MTDSHRNDCGCCAGLDGETPKRIDNRPGLGAIKYRVGEHGYFKESLLARLSGVDLPQLTRLSTRADSDFTIALCDALATTLDVLSFYQERIANENYLRTATERFSVQEMGRLIGYELAPGVAASTWLAFCLQETPGSAMSLVEPAVLPAGVRVQSVPGQDEQAQTFETVEAVEARVEWNSMPVQTTLAWHPQGGDTSLWLAGLGAGVQPGDVILIVGRERLDASGSERWDIRLVASVVEDKIRERTRITWNGGLGSSFPKMLPADSGVKVYVFRQRAALFGHNAPDPRLMSSRGGSQLSDLVVGKKSNMLWQNFSIQGNEIDLDNAYPKILPDSWFALLVNENTQNAGGLPGYVELYQAKTVSFPSRRDFGLSGKITRLIPYVNGGEKEAENLDIFRNRMREVLVLAQSEELAVSATVLGYPLYGAELALAGLAPDLLPGRVLAMSGKRACIRLRAGESAVSLYLDDGGSTKVVEGDILHLAAPPERQLGREWGQLSPAFFGRYIEERSSIRLRLKVLDRDKKPGLLSLAASAIELVPAAKTDVVVEEIVFINHLPGSVTNDRDRTTILLAKAMQHCYDRETARVNANVARATHGETVSEILGSGDARRGNAVFTLRQSPLTYVGAPTPSGRASTLTLQVNDLQWQEVDSLCGQQANARVYSLRHGDGGISSVLFGDGVEGARPVSGEHNLRAVYRKGLGLCGNVGPGKLTTLLTRPLGLSGVTNPEAAKGGEDPEKKEQAQQNAPLTVLTIDRAVSMSDYQDFARCFAGIDKAHALWIASGPARGIFITVAGPNGASIIEDSKTYADLQDALRLYGDPLIPIRIVSYRDARFRLEMAVKVTGDSDRQLVLSSVSEQLRQGFGFSARDFGQPVSVDEVVAVAHAVPGVEAVHVSRLQRQGMTPPAAWRRRFLSPAMRLGFGGFVQEMTEPHGNLIQPKISPRLFALLPVASLTDIPSAAELLLLDENAFTLELMP